jgi:hypothetical protein
MDILAVSAQSDLLERDIVKLNADSLVKLIDCGSNLHDPVQKASSSSQCNEICTGNSAQKCGGIDRLQLFSRTVLIPFL